MAIDYLSQGIFTELSPLHVKLASELPSDPVAICAAVAGFVIHPMVAQPLGLPEHRFATSNDRPVSQILDAMLALDERPLDEQRPPELRVVGTCRHFATVAVALLRARGIPARARCGFATYFVPGKFVDHWVPEILGYDRWRRIDPEILETAKTLRPDDLAPTDFLSGGEAWRLIRSGGADPMLFGVTNDDAAWGPGEIRGNAIRDLASLMKVETLPWDSWGRMDASYNGETGADYDELIDLLAGVCASDDGRRIEALYGSEDLAAPADISVA